MTSTAARTSVAGYVINPLPEAELERIRAAGVDDFGNPLAAVTVEESVLPSVAACATLGLAK